MKISRNTVVELSKIKWKVINEMGLFHPEADKIMSSFDALLSDLKEVKIEKDR